MPTDKFDRNLQENEVNFLGTLYDEIEIEKLETVEDEIRSLEDRYVERTFLAEGGLKTIERAIDKVTGREVALAIPRDSEDLVIREKFFREARLTASLEHPNIVPVYDLGLDRVEQPYFAMKLIKGQTLKVLLKDEKVSLDEKLEIFIKVCHALSYSHSQGILHLDIKPDNIQISSFGEVSVCDWGLGKFLGGQDIPTVSTKTIDQFEVDHMTVDGMIKGTPGYMSPEQISGETKTTQTDIYSLGAMLFELLYGVPPITGTDPVVILKETLAGAIKVPAKQVPQPLKAVALKALEVNPDDRYETVEELYEEIRNYRAGHATLAENAGFWRLFLLMVRRNRALSLTIAFFVSILFISTYQFIDSLQKSEQEARSLLVKLQQENRDKLTLAEDAKPRLSARIDRAFEKYNLVEAESYIAKLSELLPKSEVARRYRGRLSFLISNYEAAQKELVEPDGEIDKLLVKYLNSPKMRKDKEELINGLFLIQENGAMIYLRSFYLTHDNRVVSDRIEEIVAKWRFVQDAFHMFEVAKVAPLPSQTDILKRIYSLLSKGSWSGASEVAHAAGRLAGPEELREKFLRMFTRNLALMKKVKSTGTNSSPAFNAVDGRKDKPSNRWEAGPCPASLTVDLGEEKSFNKVMIYFRLRNPETFYYQISYSQDGHKFHLLVDASENKLKPTGLDRTHRFEHVKGRYVKLKVLGSDRDDRAFVREFEVYNEVKNLAVGQFCYQGDKSLVNLTNGSSYKGAYSEITPEEPVYIDLGEICDFQAVRITFKQAGAIKSKISYSVDGQSYKLIENFGEADFSWHVFKPLQGRYLKFEFTGAPQILINEIRVGKVTQYPGLVE